MTLTTELQNVSSNNLTHLVLSRITPLTTNQLYRKWEKEYGEKRRKRGFGAYLSLKIKVLHAKMDKEYAKMKQK